MKKVLLATVLLSSMVLVGANTASAAEVKSADTPVGIEFETEDGTTIIPGTYKGVLTLVYKPTSFEFGVNKATGGLITYNAQVPAGANPDQWLVVNDDRENPEKPLGSSDDNDVKGGSWTLKAKMAKLVNSEATELPAKLSMGLGAPMAYTIGENANGNDIIPNPATDEFIKGVAKGVKVAGATELTDPGSLSLEAGSASETVVMTKAEANTEKVGAATKVSDAKLSVQAPTTVAGQRFTSKVTWTLYTGIN